MHEAGAQNVGDALREREMRITDYGRGCRGECGGKGLWVGALKSQGVS